MDLTAHSPIFAGEFRHGIDPKNRITIPSRWRKGDADEFYIVPDAKGFLSVMPPAEFNFVGPRVNETTGLTAQQKRDFLRQFYAKAKHSPADKQGRMLLPEDCCKAVGLQGEVVLVGTHNRFEIWNPERWEAFQAVNAPSYQQVADLVGL